MRVPPTHRGLGSQESSRRVAIAGDFYFQSGAAQGARVKCLALGLRDAGWHVTAIALESNAGVDALGVAEAWAGVSRAVVGGTRRLSGFVGRYRTAKRLLREAGVSTLIVYGGSFSVIAPLFLAGQRLGLRVIVEVCEWFPRAAFGGRQGTIEYLNDWLGRQLGRGADGVIAITDYIVQRFAGSRVPMLVVPSMFDMQRPPCDLVDAQLSPLASMNVLYAGKFKPEDGVECLIEAVHICRRSQLDVHLWLAGDGRARDYESIVNASPGLRDAVTFLGPLYGNDYLAHLSAADALVLPRPDQAINRANFPTRLPEFLWSGRPLIMSFSGEVPRYLRAGVDFENAGGGTAQEIARAINALAADRARAARIGEQGRRRGIECFDYRPHGRRVSDFITSLRTSGAQLRISDTVDDRDGGDASLPIEELSATIGTNERPGAPEGRRIAEWNASDLIDSSLVVGYHEQHNSRAALIQKVGDEVLFTPHTSRDHVALPFVPLDQVADRIRVMTVHLDGAAIDCTVHVQDERYGLLASRRIRNAGPFTLVASVAPSVAAIRIVYFEERTLRPQRLPTHVRLLDHGPYPTDQHRSGPLVPAAAEDG
jgi:glycosyltransferase involved in cell wall biosynthesis